MTKTHCENEQRCQWSGDRLQKREQGSENLGGENAFIKQALLSIHKVPSTQKGFTQKDR